jgi:hypothetical protein
VLFWFPAVPLMFSFISMSFDMFKGWLSCTVQFSMIEYSAQQTGRGINLEARVTTLRGRFNVCVCCFIPCHFGCILRCSWARFDSRDMHSFWLIV